ncbi:YqzE family protein [Brevibacillus fulvus]|uniref:YqzE family protein n=1 Tax=Brevibacillus fulvus TaxID=1125967 RepID=A0A938XRK2_9BACL|nr:YqzE family protein [Brevibacillus fulvus]MBM7588547.1 hypothetical protein [Brevibacillus fulvus]
MSFQEYLKFLTKEVVSYMALPPETRSQRKTAREQWTSRWFGAIPMSIKLLWRK